MKQGVLLDLDKINRDLADAEAAEFTPEEMLDEAPAETGVAISARTIHEAYMALRAATARTRVVQLQHYQVDQQLQKDEITSEVYDKLTLQLEIEGLQAAAQMELAKIEVDRVNALVHFFEIDLLAQAGRQ